MEWILICSSLLCGFILLFIIVWGIKVFFFPDWEYRNLSSVASFFGRFKYWKSSNTSSGRSRFHPANFDPTYVTELTKKALQNHPNVPTLIVYKRRKDLQPLQDYLESVGKQLEITTDVRKVVGAQNGQILALCASLACCGFTLPRRTLLACICPMTKEQHLQIFHRVRHPDGPIEYLTPRLIGNRYVG